MSNKVTFIADERIEKGQVCFVDPETGRIKPVVNKWIINMVSALPQGEVEKIRKHWDTQVASMKDEEFRIPMMILPRAALHRGGVHSADIKTASAGNGSFISNRNRRIYLNQIFELSGTYLKHPTTIFMTVEKSRSKVAVCDHKWRVYDSGFSRYQYCDVPGCDAKKEA